MITLYFIFVVSLTFLCALDMAHFDELLVLQSFPFDKSNLSRILTSIPCRQRPSESTASLLTVLVHRLAHQKVIYDVPGVTIATHLCCQMPAFLARVGYSSGNSVSLGNVCHSRGKWNKLSWILDNLLKSRERRALFYLL